MGIGPAVRKILPPRLERAAADGYRRMFVNLNIVADVIAGLGTFPTMIEVGCGEGAMMSRLIDRLPGSATGLGIDICAHPGAKYTGRNTAVTFRQADAADIVAEGATFDLVVVSDVLHHIPPAQRGAFLQSCRDLLAPSGTVVVKEWVRRRNVAHLAAYTSDRFITGDKNVAFYTYAELKDAFVAAFTPDRATLVERETRPHKNNVLLATSR